MRLACCTSFVWAEADLGLAATQGASNVQAALRPSSGALQLEQVLVHAQSLAAQLQAGLSFSHQQRPVRHLHVCRAPSWHCHASGNHHLLAGAGNCHDHLTLERVADGHCLTDWASHRAFQAEGALQASRAGCESQVVEDVLASGLVLEGDSASGLALSEGVEVQLAVLLGQAGHIHVRGRSQLCGGVCLLQVNDHLEALGLVQPVGHLDTLYMGLLGHHLSPSTAAIRSWLYTPAQRLIGPPSAQDIPVHNGVQDMNRCQLCMSAAVQTDMTWHVLRISRALLPCGYSQASQKAAYVQAESV